MGTSFQKKQTKDLTTGSIWKQLVLFSIPLILGDLLQQLYSTTDSIIVGRYIGKQALAAVTGTETTTNIIIGLFTGLSMGVTIVLSKIFGAKNNAELHKAVHTTVIMGTVSGIICSVVGCIATPLLLRFLSTPEDVFHDALVYLSIYFGGVLGLVMYNMLGSVLRAVGNTRLPLFALVITSVCNIGLDVLFVVVFRWGIAGAAIATVVSQFASALYLFYVLCTSDDVFRYNIGELLYDKKISAEIVRVGLPIGLQKTLIATSNTVIISHINRFGSGAMAAWGVYRKLDRLLLNVAQNLSVAVSTFIGQNRGAKKYDRISSGVRTGYFLAVGSTLFFVLVLVLNRHFLITLFNSERDVIAYGAEMILFLMPFQIISSINQIQTGTIRGYGDSKGPMYIMLVSHILIRQIFLSVAWRKWPVLKTALSCYPVAWFSCFFLLLVYERKKIRGKKE